MIAGVATLALGILLTAYAARLDRLHRISERQAQAQADLSDFRARLETEVYTGIALAKGLAAQLVIHEGMPPDEFKAVAEQLRGDNPYIIDISLAPGFVIRDIYPMRGNEMQLGWDLLGDEVQKVAVLRAVQLDDAVLAGPFTHPQGNPVLAGRIPLWVDQDRVPRLWGVVSVTLDYNQLMADAGIRKLEKELQVSIRGRDAIGPGGEMIRGEPMPSMTDAIKVPVFLPGGSWLISARPAEGWYAKPWWLTPTGIAGLSLSALLALALLRIVQDRQRIRLLARSDALTSLPNRRWALSHLSRLMLRGERAGEAFALLSFDLNGFKPVNDTYGHAAGDHLLSVVAQRLGDSMRPGDLVARMGGDEFLAMVRFDPAQGDEWLRQLAVRVQEVIHQPVLIEGQPVQVGTSIGIACFPRDGSDALTLLRRADEAMYRAKRERGSGLAFACDDRGDASESA